MDDRLASDFVALWQSELTAMAADRELRESWAAALALWAQAAEAAMRATVASLPHEHAPSRSPGAAQPQGAAPAAAAPGPGMDEIHELHRRVAELEQRLADFMGRQDGGPGNGQNGA